jgi:PST family polysaccharide transporter
LSGGGFVDEDRMLHKLISKKTKSDISVTIAAHAVILLCPLISLPILINSMGLANYGKLAIILGASAFISLFTDFGFGASATRQLAHTTSKQRRSKIFWEIQFLKLFTFVAIQASAIGLLHILPSDEEFRKAAIIGCLLVGLGNLIFPSWFYEGIREFKSLSKAIILTKVTQIILLYMYVDSTNDLIIATAIEACSGVLCAILIWKRLTINISRPKKIFFHSSLRQIRNAVPFFLTKLSVSLYTTANPIILGSFAPASAVGLYAAAEKIITGSKQLLTPIAVTMYPKLIYSRSTNIQQYFKQLKYLVIFYAAASIHIGLGLTIFATQVLSLLTLKNIEGHSTLLIIMSPIPFLAAMSGAAANHVLIAFNLESYIWITTGIIAILSLFLSTILSYYLLEYGLAVSVVVTELLIALSLGLIAIKTIRASTEKDHYV